MWAEAFLISPQQVTYALLCRDVLPTGLSSTERVSAAIAVRHALTSDPRTLVYLWPGCESGPARALVAALLAGHYAHQHGGSRLPSTESRGLFKGDLLFVTQAVADTRAELERLRLGGIPLNEIWEVAPLSRYTSAKGAKPRVFLANPGWALKSLEGRRFGAVVIDASHPRTLSFMRELLRLAEGASSVRVAVCPPIPNGEIGDASKLIIWQWDPVAESLAEMAVSGQRTFPPSRQTGRHLWICDSDVEADKVLSSLQQKLRGALRASSGGTYPGLSNVWAIYRRLSGGLVPLGELEQAQAKSWSGNLRQRFQLLEEVSGSGSAAWDSTWPALVEGARAAYQLLMTRTEPAKFWAIAARLAELLATGTRVRVVVGSVAEAGLLSDMLSSVLDGYSEAVADGLLEFMTQRGEAERVAAGEHVHTLLSGPRSAFYRYLDVFPRAHTDVFLYSHEFPVERGNQERLWAHANARQDEAGRTQLLAQCGLPPPKSPSEAPSLSPTTLTCQTATGHPISTVLNADVEGEMDLDGIAQWESATHGVGSRTQRPTRKGATVTVRFKGGVERSFYPDEQVDVFFSAIDRVQRERVLELKVGWQVVSFVDGEYDGLFRRIEEAVAMRLHVRERLALELWQVAKERLVTSGPSKRAVHSRLQAAGLTTGYETFATWLREGEEGALAPQHFAEFEILARVSGAFSGPSTIQSAFEAVQRARGRNRVAGRALSAFLRALISGSQYEAAIESARMLDAALADVLAAVEILEVEEITSNEGKDIGRAHETLLALLS